MNHDRMSDRMRRAAEILARYDHPYEGEAEDDGGDDNPEVDEVRQMLDLAEAIDILMEEAGW